MHHHTDLSAESVVPKLKLMLLFWLPNSADVCFLWGLMEEGSMHLVSFIYYWAQWHQTIWEYLQYMENTYHVKCIRNYSEINSVIIYRYKYTQAQALKAIFLWWVVNLLT